MRGKTLDLGSGPTPRSLPDHDAYGIDICMEGQLQPVPGNVVPVDLNLFPIPFDTSTFDRVMAHDFLEHVPRLLYVEEMMYKEKGDTPLRQADKVVRRRQPFLSLLNEVWRVLKPGGVFESCTPMVTYLQTWAGDPTHVNPISENTFNYIVAQPGVNFEYELMKRYGFVGCFRLIHKSWRHGSHLYVEMEAVK